MSEETNKEELKDCILTITLTPEGKVLVSGHLENEPLMFWMLEKAKDTIKAHNIKKSMEQKKIINAKGGIMNFIHRKRF